MNGSWLGIVLVCSCLTAVYAPPPNRNAGNTDTAEPTNAPPPESKPQYQFAYQKYLEHVVQILQNDPKFNEKLKTMEPDDIKSGKIADHLDDLPSTIFDELTKAKLAEIERLRDEIGKQIERDGGAQNVKIPDHIDVQNWEKFNKEDLRKLVVNAVKDMEELDKQRREEFKEYEMRKKAEEDHKLAQLTPEERAKVSAEIKEKSERHNEHEKLKHPGGREQLEEVWEETDQMDKDSYNPRTFFALHDLNGDGFWNDDEIEALFRLELSKLYNESNPDDDPREKIEEMYRMREHVVAQMDKNNDRLISLAEFLSDNEAQVDDNKDDGWNDIGDQKIYTDEELQKFEREYASQNGWDSNNQGQVPPQAPVAHNSPPVAQAPPVPAGQQPQQVHPAQPPAVPVQPQAPAVPVQPQVVPVQQAQAVPQPAQGGAPIDPGYGV